MSWINGLPKSEGWYWTRDKDGYDSIIKVSKRCDGLVYNMYHERSPTFYLSSNVWIAQHQKVKEPDK